MNLTLKRKTYTNKSTIGDLSINGVFFCNTLEDVSRDKNKDGDLNDVGETKVYAKTAIPSGKYEVVITFSNRFKKYMPLLIDVKVFAGIRIHKGNKPEDTEGCILLGQNPSIDWISNSSVTVEKFMKLLKSVERKEKIFKTIID